MKEQGSEGVREQGIKGARGGVVRERGARPRSQNVPPDETFTT